MSIDKTFLQPLSELSSLNKSSLHNLMEKEIMWDLKDFSQYYGNPENKAQEEWEMSALGFNQINLLLTVIVKASLTILSRNYMGPKNLDDLINIVHHCNMNKKKQVLEKRKVEGVDIDAGKPEGWEGPEAALKEYFRLLDLNKGKMDGSGPELELLEKFKLLEHTEEELTFVENIETFNVEILGRPLAIGPIRTLNWGEMNWLIKAIKEEREEELEAIENGDPVGVIDALIDQIYFCVGGLITSKCSPGLILELLKLKTNQFLSGCNSGDSYPVMWGNLEESNPNTFKIQKAYIDYSLKDLILLFTAPPESLGNFLTKESKIEALEMVEGYSNSKKEKVGAVLVLEHKGKFSIEGVGFNHQFSHGCTCENSLGITHPGTIHAEEGALKGAKIDHVNLTLLVTMSPCMSCTNLILSNNVGAVYYRKPYRELLGLDILKEAGVKVGTMEDFLKE